MLKNKHWLVLLVGVFATFWSQDVFADYYSLSMTSSGSQSVEVLMGSDGKGTSISEDQIEVETTCRYGYNLSIGASVNDNNLYLDGDVSNNAAGAFLSPSNGSTALSSADNTWGYYFNQTTPPTALSVFSAVPASGSTKANIITESSVAGQSNIDDHFSIYYGVSITQSIQPGIYKMIPDANNNNANGTVVYYLTMAANCMPYTIHYNANGGTGTMADQEGYKDVATTLSPVTFTAPTDYEFKEWNTEDDGSGDSYTDEESITDLVAPGQEITLYAIWWQLPKTINLYNAVASMSNGTQSRTDLQTTISTTNSGVFEYNSSVFGTDTDGVKQDNTKAKIYYYRGILDSAFTTSTYGSGGNGELSPNYVILSPTGEKGTSDTCWRIIRTTGSGGVKMIYNGKWTGSTCANVQNNARTGTSTFNTGSGSNPVRRIALAGYTYNTYGNSTSTTATSTDNLFGSNTNYSGNTNSSTIKGNIDTWYVNNLNSYTSILESNAGFCNDRTTYSNTAGTTVINSLRPSATTSNNGNTAYFGAYSRNGYNSTTRIPSLACPSTRSTVDVYTTSSASVGNKQLTNPIALITADELSFAGAGAQTANQGSAYSQSSFVRSGNNFWTMSPHSRQNRNTNMYYSNANGYLSGGTITTNTYDVRPVISLKEGTEAVEGTGTAVDPWVVVAP